MTAEAIRAVLFDFGGVLAEEGFHNGLRALAKQQGLDAAVMSEQGMRAVYDSGFVLGHGTQADFWALLRERTGLAGEDAALSQCILEGFIIRPWMIELVQALRRQGFITAILSDQTHWLDELDKRYHFFQAFDRVYNSYYLGKGKRDPSLFGDIARELDLPPAALLLVDDNAANVRRARDAGLQTIQFIDRPGLLAALQRLTGVEPLS